MSFNGSEFSDILEKDDTEALYNNVNDIVKLVEMDDLCPNLSQTMENTNTLPFNQIGNGDVLKQEVFSDLNIPPNMQFSQQMPPVFTTPLKVCNEEYAGPYNFDVSIIPNGSKNPWVYSTMLNKVFIDMGNYFPVEFRVNYRDIEELYVRVTPSFSSLQHCQELVYRCVQHEQPQFNKDIPMHIRQHIIRCSNERSFYLGNREENQRLSILFPLTNPQPGTDAVREMFVFVCKSSCPSGMNRKPIEIIFSLEKYDGEILGRRILNVRICSCPKRDKDKEEKDSVDKAPACNSKKRKIDVKDKKVALPESNDKNMHNLTMVLPSKAHALRMLQLGQDMMAGEIMRNPQSTTYLDVYKRLQAQANQLQPKEEA